MTGIDIVIETNSKLTREAWDLAVYKRAYALSLEIHQATQTFPQSERFELASQMRRCSKSICANLAEGFAKQRFSTPEFKRFIGIAIGSAAEMQVWVQYCSDLGYISMEQVGHWQEEYTIISRMLMKLHVSLSSQPVN